MLAVGPAVEPAGWRVFLCVHFLNLAGSRGVLGTVYGKRLAMEVPREATLLRIFVSEDDKVGGRPLYQAIVLKARDAHLGGATVLRGALGFGRSTVVHASKVLRLRTEQPLVIEIVDSKEKIDAFLPTLDEIMTHGLITMEKAEVIRYGLSR
jgi:PII-like signaling protein